MMTEATDILADLDFPADLHYQIGHQVWARVDAQTGMATVGITALGIRLSGDIYMCRPKRRGTLLEQGGSVAVVELAKSIVSVKSPVSGEVVDVNPLLADQPDLVHRQPYDDGWLVRVRLTRWDRDVQELLHGDTVLPAMRHHAWLNRVQ